ncbi:hypothetical protein BDM02DRAFT_3124119 [Thelephora ganbajun]|uniref:Uncharacterized protein n=1 Tax=Thelephora ganbajun TaxID=370292 RepID=A0ACB6YZG9_THEGA|nr:hypothetical protein BDM02DRAFT_3124119 [Thelephora ganbajun]
MSPGYVGSSQRANAPYMIATRMFWVLGCPDESHADISGADHQVTQEPSSKTNDALNLTQKHHFSLLHLDSFNTTNKWRTQIAPDPAGVSRHVRKLVLDNFGPENFEGSEDFGGHMRAFTQVKSLMVRDCEDVFLYVAMGLFLPMKSSLVELQVCDLSATPLTITPLLAALPLLNCVEIYEFWVYPEGSLDWIPPSTRFAHLDIDTECAMHHPDPVNQWLASSRETLTNLAIRWKDDVPIPKKPTSLDLSPCTSLEFLEIPIWPFAEMILPHLNSSRLAKVILYWYGRAGQGTAKVVNNTWKAIEEHLRPIAKAYNRAYPERKMVVEILIGPDGKHHERRVEVLRILDDEKFMSQLKEEAEVVVR